LYVLESYILVLAVIQQWESGRETLSNIGWFPTICGRPNQTRCTRSLESRACLWIWYSFWKVWHL